MIPSGKQHYFSELVTVNKLFFANLTVGIKADIILPKNGKNE